MKIDPVLLNILGNGFKAIAREMGANLVRAAFSTVIREVKDVAAAILNTDGEIIAQAEYIAVHLGGLPLAFKGSVGKYKLEEITPEDAFIINDPYNGGQHLQDWILFSPIFCQGRLICFAGCSAHHIDIGGGAAGFHAGATDVYSEGLQIPGLKFNVSRDWRGGILEQMIRQNIRVPDKTIGDVNAQFAANHTARNRLNELVEKYGASTIITAMDELMDYSEARTREKIRQLLKPGVYTAEEKMENDPFSDQIATIRVKVTVDESDVLVDFGGTDEQVPGPNNNPIASTVASSNAAIRCLINDPSIPFNSGCNRPIRIEVPKGSILNPTRPTPVRCRMTPSYRAFGAIVRALGEGNPSLAVASNWDTNIIAVFSHFDTRARQHNIFEDIEGGGFGASAIRDGEAGIDQPLANTLNTPVEAMESEFDFIKSIDYRLVKDGFGRGQFRGGQGISKHYLITKDGVVFSGYLDRRRVPPRGIFGGEDGTIGGFRVISADGEAVDLPCLASYRLKKGDIVEIKAGGGGGYGPPGKRSRELVERDIREGRSSF